MKSKKISTYGLLVALAFILSYIESLFPIPLPFPGIKVGLANLVVVAALYSMGVKEAFVLSIIRIVLVGLTFGNLSMMMFSFGGGLLSWLLMVLAKRSKLFGLVGVSVVGGLSHNIGQIGVAMVVVENISILGYLPVLLVFGAISGTVIGIIGSLIVKRLNNISLS